MSFNIPVFAIPGMMPTTHPVTESIYFAQLTGKVDLVLSTTEEEPESVSFFLTDYGGRKFLTDSEGEFFVREEDSNKFVFGSDEDGYLPVGTYYLWANIDGIVTKFTITNADNPFNLADNSAFVAP